MGAPCYGKNCVISSCQVATTIRIHVPSSSLCPFLTSLPGSPIHLGRFTKTAPSPQKPEREHPSCRKRDWQSGCGESCGLEARGQCRPGSVIQQPETWGQPHVHGELRFPIFLPSSQWEGRVLWLSYRALGKQSRLASLDSSSGHNKPRVTFSW